MITLLCCFLGSAVLCPVDLAKPAGTPCRVGIGACDMEDTCDGTNKQCVDRLFDNTHVCRAAAPATNGTSTCDKHDFCDGKSTECPDDAVMMAGTPCFMGVGCELALQCDGTDGLCPPFRFKEVGLPCDAPTATCGTTQAVCIAGGRCSGKRVDCTCADAADCDDQNPCTTDTCKDAACTYSPAPAGTLCRDAVSLCDVPEVCDGLAEACPSDAVSVAGVECRGRNGPCDEVETVRARASVGCLWVRSPWCVQCDGVSNACPRDGFLKGTVCRERPDAACDEPERCSGDAAACPTDRLKVFGTPCHSAGAGAQQCRAAQFCNGISAFCEDADVAPDGSQCDDGDSWYAAARSCRRDVALTARTLQHTRRVLRQRPVWRRALCVRVPARRGLRQGERV